MNASEQGKANRKKIYKKSIQTHRPTTCSHSQNSHQNTRLETIIRKGRCRPYDCYFSLSEFLDISVLLIYVCMYIPVYICIRGFYCIVFPFYTAMAANYSCLSPYSLPLPHLPSPSSLDPVWPSHPSITICCISLSYGDISVPLVPYSVPSLWRTMDCSLVIIALKAIIHIN